MAERYDPHHARWCCQLAIKGLAPRRLDPARYHLNPNADLNELEKGMPWRTIQDEFGKFKWVDHAGRIYHGTPFSVEPDVTSKAHLSLQA